MIGILSGAKARVGHRLAMHLHVDRFRLRNRTPMVSFTFDDLPKSAVTMGAGLLEALAGLGADLIDPAAVSEPASAY